VTAAIDTAGKGTAAGIAPVLELGIVDAYKPKISTTDPFYVRTGICYRSANGKPASAASFTITRGYHSYGGGTIGGGPDVLALRAFYNKLNNLYVANNIHQNCDNLVGNNLLPVDVPINLQCPANPVLPGCPYSPDRGTTLYSGCPANGITLLSSTPGGCPPGTVQGRDNRGQDVCVYALSTLSPATALSDITNPDGSYNDTPDAQGLIGLDKYYYDAGTGWLFLYVAQQNANAVGASPLANCAQSPIDPSCPDTANKETYYVCPPEGCKDYVIAVTDPGYKPGASNCDDPYVAGFGAPEPPPLYHLVVTGSTTSVVRNPIAGAFPHYTASPPTTPVCN
jgi:hypothetical protein